MDGFTHQERMNVNKSIAQMKEASKEKHRQCVLCKPWPTYLRLYIRIYVHMYVYVYMHPQCTDLPPTTLPNPLQCPSVMTVSIISVMKKVSHSIE